MRLIVPHVGNINPEVHAALEDCHWQPRYCNVGYSDRAYFDLLAELWATQETVVIVEHDIVVNPRSILELAYCQCDWCAFPYPYMSIPAYYGLGCVKFGANLMRRQPDAIRRVGVLSDERHPQRHWCRLDGFLQYVVLPSLGESIHRHDEPVTHLGRGCAHGCTTVS